MKSEEETHKMFLFLLHKCKKSHLFTEKYRNVKIARLLYIKASIRVYSENVANVMMIYEKNLTCLYSTLDEDPTTTTPRQEMPINDDPQPVIKAKNSAKYSTKTRQDHRPSAQAIGSFGVVIIAVILGAIVAIDVGTIGKEVKRCSRKKSSASKNRINEDNISIRSISARSFTNVSSNNPDRQPTS